MKHPESNFLQSPSWGKINQRLGHKVITEDLKNGDSCLCIIKSARRGRYLEIPGGPLLDWDDQAKVEATFEKIKDLARKNRCAFVRLRPQLLKTEENLETLKALGARPASFHLHAEHTVIIDLTKSEDDLLKDMRRQTRYEVRRAEKLGLKVEKSTDKQAFEEFHKIQSETAARQHFIPPTLKDLLAYHEVFKDKAVIYKTTAPAEVSAKNRQEPPAPDKTSGKTPGSSEQIVALGLIIISGDEADYFEAASTDLNRKLPGAYALLWQVMKDLKKQKIKRFNLWGIAPPGSKNHRYSGVTTFKTGFGGEVTEFVPAHDIPISLPRYQLVRAIETVRKKRRHL